MSYPEGWDWEPPDPPQDESVQVRCVNRECFLYWDGESRPRGELFHPTTEEEYQGVPPHGGIVHIYTDDAFDCPECGQPGEEVE